MTGDVSLLDDLESLIHSARDLVNQPSLYPAIKDQILRVARMLNDADLRCPYTFSHTRHWCGYEDCRDS